MIYCTSINFAGQLIGLCFSKTKYTITEFELGNRAADIQGGGRRDSRGSGGGGAEKQQREEREREEAMRAETPQEETSQRGWEWPKRPRTEKNESKMDTECEGEAS